MAEQTTFTRRDSSPTNENEPSPPIYASPANLAPAPATDSGTRRSTRKRKQREDLPDLAADLEACLCGFSAVPHDDSDHPNLARCKNEGCETKWYHLRCLERGSVPEG
ncbi:hypothetical protein B0H14DRAFT_3468488 [Mycena olivaceomarginata]|nr:hypothetical protein B0H14DRAFT_3468488 [Mycena olivaceomarginata]